MLAFGVCVQDAAVFGAKALPGLRRVVPAGAPLLTVEHSDPLAGRRQILAGMSEVADVEALVLVDQSAEFLDGRAMGVLQSHLAEGVDVVALRGALDDPTGALALTRTAVARLVAQLTVPGPLSLADVVSAAREAGLRVRQEYGLLAPATSSQDGGEQHYYGEERPELTTLVPAGARRVLDVGCAAGRLGARVKREHPGITVCGVELVPEVAAIAATRLDEAWQRNLDEERELPVPDGYFDVMIFGDVLEHLRDPEQAVRDLTRYLAPEGVVIASIPNVLHHSVIGPALVSDEWTYTDAGLLDRTHIHLFTLHEALAMFDRLGFGRRWHLGGTGTSGGGPLIDGLVAAAAAAGADPASVRERLNVYQYHLGLARG